MSDNEKNPNEATEASEAVAPEVGLGETQASDESAPAGSDAATPDGPY